MRLAVNAISIAPGGGLTVLIGLLRAWREIGADLDITVFASRDSVLRAIRSCRSDLKTVPVLANSPSWKRFVYERVWLGRLVDAVKPDVVLTTNWLVGRCRAPQIVHHQNLWHFIPRIPRQSLLPGGLRLLVQNWAAREALREAQANVFISHYMKRQAERILPGAASRYHVIYNGLPSDTTRSPKQPTASFPESAGLLAITSALPHKGNPILVHALANLVHQRPDVPWHLNVVGVGEKDMTSERRIAKHLGVSDQITWLGFASPERVEFMLRASFCLLFTSTLEAFGLPIIEAMAASCPVVASNCTAIPEIVGEAGILVEPGNAAQFADAVLTLYGNRALRQELVDRGLARVPKFSWQVSASQFFQLVETLLSPGKHAIGPRHEQI